MRSLAFPGVVPAWLIVSIIGLTITLSSAFLAPSIINQKTIHAPATHVHAQAKTRLSDQAPLNGNGHDKDNNTPFQELQDDFQSLTELCPPKPAADPSLSATIVSAGSSYTRIWTHETWRIHSNPPHRRYMRHVRKWNKSSTARIILPAVGMATAWSIVVSLIAKYLNLRPIQAAMTMVGSSSTSAVSLLSAPLALLLTLRANASMARLLEARQAWGKLILHARGLSSILANYVYPNNPQAAILSVRYLAVLGWILKAQLRGEDDESQRKILRQMLSDDDEYNWIVNQPKRSVAITSRIRQLCCLALSSSPTSSSMLIVEERIRELETVVDICERLFGSPIPPTYTRHLSRVMSLWILLLPISLIATGRLNTVGVAFASTIAAYVFIGLDEVGMEIENVVQLLPLQQLAAAAQKDVQSQFAMVNPNCAPPLLTHISQPTMSI